MNTEFPRIKIGKHYVRPYQSSEEPLIDLTNPLGGKIPYLQYSAHTYMTRVVEQLIKKAPFKARLNTVYRASIAESLLTAAQKGLGVAWLPDVIVSDQPEESGLRLLTDEWSSPLEISVYRSIDNLNPSVLKIWEQLSANDKLE